MSNVEEKDAISAAMQVLMGLGMKDPGGCVRMSALLTNLVTTLGDYHVQMGGNIDEWKDAVKKEMDQLEVQLIRIELPPHPKGTLQ